jgi:transcriptional regulator with XRE-family HTH domain
MVECILCIGRKVWGVHVISPYVRRLRLAEELRALRVERGLTHEQLARQIGQSRAQISRLENGHTVDQNDVMKILEVLEVDDDRWTQIVTIAREAGERGWWESNKAMGSRQALYADLEAGAESIREFQMTFIPGLLQTPEFARARVEAERVAGPVTYTADKAVEARNARQRMLRRPNGPSYEVVIDEVAVRRPAAPGEIVRAQLYNVAARVNRDPKTTVRVLPLGAAVDGYFVPRGAFSIYTFSDPGDPTVVLVDTVTDDLVLTDPEDVQRYEGLYTRLREAALTTMASLDLLSEAARRRPAGETMRASASASRARPAHKARVRPSVHAARS